MRMMDMGRPVRALIVDRHGDVGSVGCGVLAGIQEPRFETTMISSSTEIRERRGIGPGKSGQARYLDAP
jgi:hypothetical protein